MATRSEVTAAVAQRYGQADRAEKTRLLDEFVLVSGYHRKHAMRLLRASKEERARTRKAPRRVYDEPAHSALIVLWEASDRICGKRLKPLLPCPCSLRRWSDTAICRRRRKSKLSCWR